MNNLKIALIALSCAALCACATAEPCPTDLASLTAVKYPDSKEIYERVAPLVPADAASIITLDTRRMFDEHLVTAFGLLDKNWDHKAMMKDLQESLIKSFGLDLTKLDWIALLGSDEEFAVAFLSGDVGQPSPDTKQTIAGLSAFHNAALDIYLVQLDGGLLAVCANTEAVEILARVKKGEAPSLASSEDNPTLQRLLDRIGNGDLVFASTLSGVDDALLAEVPMGLAEETGGLGVSLSDRLVVAIQGSPQSLESKNIKIKEMIDEFRTTLAKDMNDPESSDPLKDIVMIYAYHVSGAFSAQVTPVIQGDMLVYDLSMDLVTHPVTILGGVGVLVYYAFQAFMGGLGDMGDTPPPMEDMTPLEP